MNTNFTPETVVLSVQHLIGRLKNDRRYGPYRVFLPLALDLEKLYDPLKITLRERLLEIEGVKELYQQGTLHITVQQIPGG